VLEHQCLWLLPGTVWPGTQPGQVWPVQTPVLRRAQMHRVQARVARQRGALQERNHCLTRVR